MYFCRKIRGGFITWNGILEDVCFTYSFVSLLAAAEPQRLFLGFPKSFLDKLDMTENHIQ